MLKSFFRKSLFRIARYIFCTFPNIPCWKPLQSAIEKYFCQLRWQTNRSSWWGKKSRQFLLHSISGTTPPGTAILVWLDWPSPCLPLSRHLLYHVPKPHKQQKKTDCEMKEMIASKARLALWPGPLKRPFLSLGEAPAALFGRFVCVVDCFPGLGFAGGWVWTLFSHFICCVAEQWRYRGDNALEQRQITGSCVARKVELAKTM